MKISVISIAKSDPFEANYQDFVKKCKGFGVSLCLYNLFNSQIAKAQKNSSLEAQRAYTQAFLPYLCQNSYALHPAGRGINSIDFAKILSDKQEICFFIGGAYGLEEGFLKQTCAISLSPLTFSHQVAKIVLCEQIYRGLSINGNHPYHK